MTYLELIPTETLLWAILVLVVISTFYRLLGYSDMRNGLDNALGTLLGFIYVPFLFGALYVYFLLVI